jgi:hypothetical protein
VLICTNFPGFTSNSGFTRSSSASSSIYATVKLNPFSSTIFTTCSYKFKEDRKWQGRIVGKGIHGSINVLLAMLKHKIKASQGRTPLMGVLTICDGYWGVLDFCDEADHMDRVVNRISGSLVLGLLDKEVKEVVSTKVIIMERMLMDAITTISIDGEWRE